MRTFGWVLAGLAIGCTAHERPVPEASPSPRAALAAGMGLELPAHVGTDPLATDLSVWIGPSEVALTRGDGTVIRELARLRDGKVEGDAQHVMFDALYDSVFPENLPELDKAALTSANLFIDRRVPAGTVAVAVNTLMRGDINKFHLVGGTPDAARAVIVDMRHEYDDAPDRPIRELRSDLALTWERPGVRAWALPRSATRKPFALGREEPPPVEEGDPPPDPPYVVERVPLTPATGGDEWLDLAATGRLVSALCEFNKREPFGLQIEPMMSTEYDALLGFVAAASPPADCRGQRRMWIRDPPRRTGPPSTLAELAARVLPAQG